MMCGAVGSRKEVQNSIFGRAAVHGANMFQIFSTVFIITEIFGEVKFAGLWVCNQLVAKYLKESKSAFQMFMSETKEPIKMRLEV